MFSGPLEEISDLRNMAARNVSEESDTVPNRVGIQDS